MAQGNSGNVDGGGLSRGWIERRGSQSLAKKKGCVLTVLKGTCSLQKVIKEKNVVEQR